MLNDLRLDLQYGTGEPMIQRSQLIAVVDQMQQDSCPPGCRCKLPDERECQRKAIEWAGWIGKQLDRKV